MKVIQYITFLILCCSSASQLVAQNFYSENGTIITVLNNNDIPLFVTDTIVNDGILNNQGNINANTLFNNGTLSNNGNLLISGSWLNLGTYDAGEGQITFNSTNPSIPQVINHNNQSFSKLVISGGGLKQILADLTVEESFTLTDGIIIAQNNAKVHFSPTAIITGGSDNSHINAPVYQQGTGTKLFPIGNGTTYLPVEISGITTSSEIGVALNELQQGQTLNTASALADISDKRYWTVDVASGSLEGAKITLPVEGDEGLDPLKNNEFVVAFAESSSADFISVGRSANSTSAEIESELSFATGLLTLAVPSENLSVVVFNAISPNPDDEINNYIRIENLLESDLVSIYNRWGDLVFEMKSYNNDDQAKRFNGQSNVGGSKDLPMGNYFYVIRRKAGKEISGYLSLRK